MRLLIKIGGALLDDPARRADLAGQIAAAHRDGFTIAVVHGGGRQLTRFLEERGIESRFVNGLRVTTDSAMDAVVKVLAGTVNKQLTGALRAAGANAVGISGLDGMLTTATQLSPELGWVGRITAVNPGIIDLICMRGIPIIACIAGDERGQMWNINADRMAVACAGAYRADRLIFLTDVPGVLNAEGSVSPGLDVESARSLVSAGVARGGMQAKLEAACMAVEAGAGSVAIAPGASENVLRRLLAGEQIGTVISASVLSGRESKGTA